MQINRTLLNEKEAARRPVWVFVVIWGVVVMCHSHLGAPLSFKRVLSAVWRCPRSRSPGLLVISMKFPFCCNFNEISSAGFGFIEIRRLYVCRELKWALLSAAQPKSAHRGHRTHHARPPAPRSLPRRPPVIFLTMAVPRRGFFAQSQRRQLKSTNTNTTTLMFPLKVTWL